MQWKGSIFRRADHRIVEVERQSERLYRVKIGLLHGGTSDESMSHTEVSEKLNRFLSGVDGWMLSMPPNFYDQFEGLIEQNAEHIKAWHSQ